MRFPGGYYKLPRTIFEKLEEFNIVVDEKYRHYPWFFVFDMEAMLTEPKDECLSTSRRSLTHEHKPISVCSNVEDFTNTIFILEEDLDILVTQMMICLFFFCCFTSHVNSYGRCGTVSSLNHTFSWAGLSKRLTSNLCTYFRL